MRETALLTPRGSLLLLVPETEAERTVGANRGIPRPYAGLLFNFEPSEVPTMTMVETPMALQISFIGPDRVVHTVFRAPARSGIYTGRRLTRWVVETPGETLRVGDRVRFGV
jgi:uncharacterized membrane protein (UPF0127 family)